MRSVLAIAVVLAVVDGASATEANRHVISIMANDIAARAESDPTFAGFYTLTYSLPEGIGSETIERAILELVVDVSALSREGYVNEAPMLEVYALKQAFAGSVTGKDLDTATRAVRPVAVGPARRVKIDVTKIVRVQAAGAVNYGLVVGSVTGMREGTFTIRSNVFPDGAVARLSLYKAPVPN